MPCLLLVEPDVLARYPLAAYLRACGYRVLEASNAAEARLLITDGPAAIDLVLTEAALAGDNEFELAAWIRARYPAIDVMLVGTVAAAAEKAGDLCEDGPMLRKPYDHQVLLDQIRRLAAARDRRR